MAEELRAKALEFIRANPIAHLATMKEGRPGLRVMELSRVDDDFTVWMACGKSSGKVRQIGQCSGVALSAWADGKDLVIDGTAEIVLDDAVLQEHWQEEWKTYFPGGSRDPEYCLIKVTAGTARFRDINETGFEARNVL